VEVRAQMRAAGAGADFLHGRQIEIAVNFALKDQVAVPDFESPGLSEGCVVVAGPEPEHEIGAFLPGDLEFDGGPCGQLKSRARGRPALAGGQMTEPPEPSLPASKHSLPSRQAVRTEIDQIGAVTPAIDAEHVGLPHHDSADPRDVELEVVSFPT